MRNRISAPISVGCIAPKTIRVRFMRIGKLVTSSRSTKPFRAYIFGTVSSIDIESVRITLPINLLVKRFSYFRIRMRYSVVVIRSYQDDRLICRGMRKA